MNLKTWKWRRMLKIKWTDRITNDEVFQRAKEERLLLNIYIYIYIYIYTYIYTPLMDRAYN